MLFVLPGAGQQSDMLYEHNPLSASSFTPFSSLIRFLCGSESNNPHRPYPPFFFESG